MINGLHLNLYNVIFYYSHQKIDMTTTLSRNLIALGIKYGSNSKRKEFDYQQKKKKKNKKSQKVKQLVFELFKYDFWRTRTADRLCVRQT